MKRRALMAIPVLAVLVTACGSSGGASASCKPSPIPNHDPRALVIEGDPWSGYAPFRDPHLMDGTRFSSVYVEQLCQDVRAADVTAGRADFEVTTLDQFILNHPAGRVVGVIDQSEGADALALNTPAVPYLRSVDDLPTLRKEFSQDGKKPVLAYTGNSPSEMLLNELVNTSEDLNLADFTLVSVDQSSSAFRMLQDKSAQLAVIWEPDVSAARSAGYTIALSSKDVPDSIVDVVVASDRLIERDPAAVQAVLRAFYSTMDRYLAHPTDLEQFIAKDGGLQVADAKSVLAGVKLYGTRDADTFMNSNVFPLDRPQLAQSVKAIGSVLSLSHRSIELPSKRRIDGSYVRQLVK